MLATDQYRRYVGMYNKAINVRLIAAVYSYLPIGFFFIVRRRL